MTTRIAALSDVHGNATALAAVRKAIAAAKPDAILVAGDHVLNGPEPAATVDAIRDLEADGALVVQGNTDIAVADYDWAHDALGDERLDWLRRLPAERRLRVEDTLVLVTHASPGSQTAGFDQALDPSVTIERLSRTDARLICCGHTHLPEVRDFGWKQVINDGSAGYVFDGDPTASWALIELDGEAVTTTIQRTEYDVLEVSNALSARGLPGDIYRAATVRTGKLVR